MTYEFELSQLKQDENLLQASEQAQWTLVLPNNCYDNFRKMLHNENNRSDSSSFNSSVNV